MQQCSFKMEKAAAKRETDCFPRVWKVGNHAFKIKYEIFTSLIRNFFKIFGGSRRPDLIV